MEDLHGSMLGGFKGTRKLSMAGRRKQKSRRKEDLRNIHEPNLGGDREEPEKPKVACSSLNGGKHSSEGEG